MKVLKASKWGTLPVGSSRGMLLTRRELDNEVAESRVFVSNLFSEYLRTSRQLSQQVFRERVSIRRIEKAAEQSLYPEDREPGAER
jgi:hypothetical protein